MNGFTERLAFVLAEPLLGPDAALDPLLSCNHSRHRSITQQCRPSAGNEQRHS